MEINFSINFGKKKDKQTVVDRFNQISGIEKNGNSFFYPINFNDTNSVQALIDMYHELPEVQTPVNYLIDKMTIIPFYHYRKRGSRTELIENSRVLDIIKSPNQYQERADFIKSFFLNRVVLGVGYINRIYSVGFSSPRQLYILPSQSTKPIIKVNNKKDPRINEIEKYSVNWGEGEIILKTNEVITQYESNLDTKIDAIRSRLLSAILTSESLRANYEARVKIYRDRGALGIIAPTTTELAITKEDAEKMEHQFYQETGITGRKSPIRVSRAPLSYTQIGFNVDELKLNENKSQDFQTICNLLNIDPALFDNTRSTYNNKILAKTNFWEDVGIPQFNNFLELLGKVFNLPSNEMLIADYSNIPALQDDMEKKTNVNSKAYNDGAITQQEYREAIGYEGGEQKYKMQIEQERSSTINQEQK